MKLSQFTDMLASYAELPFHLALPGEKSIPASFHVTEVGHVTKKFIDCGGRLHTVQSCQLQVWLGSDNDHRLYAGKMAKVVGLARAKGVLPDGVDLDMEIEYEDALVSQYTVSDIAVMDHAVVLTLAAKHTDCLAKESCLPSLPMAMGAASGCGPGCC